MPKLKDFLAKKISQEISQEIEQEKVNNFHIEQFLKTRVRTKMGRRSRKSSPQSDV
jgi:hypothetical protein